MEDCNCNSNISGPLPDGLTSLVDGVYDVDGDTYPVRFIVRDSGKMLLRYTLCEHHVSAYDFTSYLPTATQ